MSEAEKEVLKTLKKGLGLTSAEQEILVNYIDKLQKENEELKKQLKVNNTFNIKESEVRTPRYIESTTLKRWWLE